MFGGRGKLPIRWARISPRSADTCMAWTQDFPPLKKLLPIKWLRFNLLLLSRFGYSSIACGSSCCLNWPEVSSVAQPQPKPAEHTSHFYSWGYFKAPFVWELVASDSRERVVKDGDQWLSAKGQVPPGGHRRFQNPPEESEGRGQPGRQGWCWSVCLFF